MTLRTLIVDDERLARVELRTLLAAHPSVEIVSEAADCAAAATALARDLPDLAFLDIQLGAGSGFALLDLVPHTCRVVFVTAYDQYAVQAFAADALDYLLKPVHPDRLAETIARVERRRGRPPTLLPVDGTVFLPSGASSSFTAVRSIACILADGDYSRVITADGRERLVPRSLTEWEQRLPAAMFARVHRSAIANLDAVHRTSRDTHGRWLLHIAALARPLVVSRRHARRLSHERS